MPGKPKLKIGSYLVSRGLISVEQAKKIKLIQEKLGPDKSERFGRIAVEVGFIKESELKQAMREKHELENK